MAVHGFKGADPAAVSGAGMAIRSRVRSRSGDPEPTTERERHIRCGCGRRCLSGPASGFWADNFEISYTAAMEIPVPTLVLNGPIQWKEALRQQVERAHPLLAADGGANALVEIGIRPSVVIGDLDSIRPELRSEMPENAILHRPDQDSCDFEKALDYAFGDAGLEGLTVLGALGGRPDHSVGNLGILARECRGTKLIFHTGVAIVLAFSGSMELESRPGETWSFWSYSPALRLSLEGVRWPLDRAPVHVEGRPSISNEAIARKIRIRVEGGTLLVCRNLED